MPRPLKITAELRSWTLHKGRRYVVGCIYNDTRTSPMLDGDMVNLSYTYIVEFDDYIIVRPGIPGQQFENWKLEKCYEHKDVGRS